jgi:hypothetical protein
MRISKKLNSFSLAKCIVYFYKIITDEILKSENKSNMVKLILLFRLVYLRRV